MKKFLTVLLVIAVMFTFSFSGAFAAGFTVDKTLAQAQFAVAWKALTDKETPSIDVTEDGVKYTIKLAVLEANKGAILDAAYALDKTEEDSSHVKDYATLVETVNSDEELYMALVEAQYAADKEEALAILAGLDTSSFSTEKMTVKTDDKYMTYVEAVKYYISLAEDAINEATFTSDSKVKDYKAAKEEIDKQFNAYAKNEGAAENDPSATAIAQETGYDENGTKYIGLGVYKVNEDFKDAAGKKLATYKTTAVNASNATDSAKREALKAAAKSDYAKYVAKNTTSEAVANADKALEATIYTIENVDDVNDAITFASLVVDGDADAEKDIEETFISNYKNVAAFETFANRYAAEKDATGALVRDAEEVAKIVKAAKLAAYQGDTDWTQAKIYAGEKSYEKAIMDLSVAGDAAELEYAIKHYEALADKYVADAKDDDTYYAKELAEVEALVAEFKAKAEALTDATKVADLYKDYFETATKKVQAVEVKDKAVTATVANADAKEVTGDIAELFKTAVTYRKLYNDSIKGTDNDYTENAYTLANAIKKMVGDAGARTAKEIAALGTEIPALVQALPTNAAVSAATDAADEAVKAAKYTDQASIDAALKAVEAYEDLTLVDYGRTDLNTKIKSMAYAELNTLNTEYTKAVKTDKAALKAIQDKIDAFVEAYEYDSDNNTVEKIFKDLAGNIEGKLAEIKIADAKAVAAKINAIPVNVTAADKATVEAARKAYDEFVAEYTDYEKATSAVTFLNGYANVSALASAEAVLGLNAPDPEENAKAYVQDLGIKARSTKTSKGVKVTIKADVQELLDAGFTVEYKFYRSTKSNKGFKAMVTKTTGTYTNTKGVKGTKYFYKVKLVVKNAAGEVVATTPLTQCLYATRTF